MSGKPGTRPPGGIAAEPPWFVEIWLDFRPYLVKLASDFLISISLWVILYLFEHLTQILPVAEWARDFIVYVHSLNIILAYAAFGILFLSDVIVLRNKGKGGQAK